MWKNLLSLATLGALAVGALWPAAPKAPATPASPVPAAPAPAPSPGPQAAATYVGGDACRKCHFTEHKAWLDTGHSRAWENLPERYRDPAQTDERGRACIACHVTGWQQPGGFQDVEASANLLGVQCEACHGPGSLHLEVGQTLLREKRRELAEGEASHIVLTTTDCADCHNPHLSYAAKYGGG